MAHRSRRSLRHPGRARSIPRDAAGQRHPRRVLVLLELPRHHPVPGPARLLPAAHDAGVAGGVFPRPSPGDAAGGHSVGEGSFASRCSFPGMPSHDPPQLFLVDGHALIYRAFFALLTRPLRTSRGENTSAAWGVVNFLLRLESKYRPDYLVWVLDAGDSFRTARYPEYKSTRQKLGLELQAGFHRATEQVGELLPAFRVPVVLVPGYAADDVIGTVARRESAAGRQVVIVSGDKDFYQLIGPRIALLNPGRGGPAGVEEQWVDESNASERLGVPPARVADYLALVGDTSDNVPGVRGIGEKGAVQLLEQFGDLETLLARAQEVKARRAREARVGSADTARLSRELVTIKTDVPVELDVQSAALREPDMPALLKVLTQLEFHSLAKRLAAPAAPTRVAPDGPADRGEEEKGKDSDSGSGGGERESGGGGRRGDRG